MTNKTKRQCLGWGLVVGVLIFFMLSFSFGGSTQMFLATSAFAHLPLFAVPIWGVFHNRNQARTIGLGWLACIFSAVLWEVCYHSLYRRFHWPQPDLPGEIIASLPFGAIPAMILVLVATGAKAVLDKKWPMEEVGR